MRKPEMLAQWINEWQKLKFYERFEQIIAIGLSLIVSLIAIAALARLGFHLLGAFADSRQWLDHRTFIALFGMIMMVLIALEFNHTVVQIVERKQTVVQIRVVIIIAMMAIIRKFIIIDLENPDTHALLAFAGVTLALGVVYWLVQDSDRRRDKLDRRPLD